MSAIPFLLFFSLLLAGTFVVLFARDHRRRRFASAERDSLLPLADETPHVAAVPLDRLGVLSSSNGESGDHPETDHAHDHAHDHGHAHAAGDNCGCRDGSRPPCPGCLRRRETPASPTT